MGALPGEVVRVGDRDVTVRIVRACLREDGGGSPTAVVEDVPMTDAERRRVPVLVGTSHAVFVTTHDGRSGSAASLRFTTAKEELPACGHGTVAALAVLARRAGVEDHRVTLHAGGRIFAGGAVLSDDHVDAFFDPGPVALRRPTEVETHLVLAALGLTPVRLADSASVASVGRPRMLVPVANRSALDALDPDPDRLRDACDHLGLLGCYAYSPPTASGRLAARMFAPSIGVPEDIANANSTACLAAHLAGPGSADIAVDMGDRLGSPSTITATVQQGPTGPTITVGGRARVVDGAITSDRPGGR